jgi:tRNA (guanine6-N2)-methyltransferase
MKKQTATLYLVHTQPGFELITAAELSGRLEAVSIKETLVVPGKNGMVLFTYAGEVQDLLQLRTIEDLFVVIMTLTDIPGSRDGLTLLERAAYGSDRLEAGLNVLRALRPERKYGGKIPFRIIARQTKQASYRRIDAQRAVERGILARKDHKWRIAETEGVELWLTIVPHAALLALRVSTHQMRHRDYKSAHITASLRPSAAAALCWLTHPDAEDVFLDPMCGAGTILIERAMLGRYQQLLGGDINAESVGVARSNIGSRYKPIELRQWDARQLPLESSSISAIAVNLPFGKQIGTTSENRSLYAAVLAEATRVLRANASLVALTSDTRSFDAALRVTRALRRKEAYSVQVLGQAARVYVVERG